jgi:hypothetical protein
MAKHAKAEVLQNANNHARAKETGRFIVLEWSHAGYGFFPKPRPL